MKILDIQEGFALKASFDTCQCRLLLSPYLNLKSGQSYEILSSLRMFSHVTSMR